MEKKTPEMKKKMDARPPPWDQGPKPYANRSAIAATISCEERDPLLMKFVRDVI